MKCIKGVLIISTYTLLLLTTLSCANYMKRKTCEQTNWHSYGKEVALKGERLSSDDFIKECEAAEALVKHDELDLGFKEGLSTYCNPSTAYKVGRAGDNFNYSFCDQKKEELRSEFTRGNKDYCTPTGGYQAGSQGKKYLNNCSKDIELAFLKRYKKGRAIFLQGDVRKKKKEIFDIEDEIRRKEREIRDLRYEIQTLPRRKVIRRDSRRGRNKERVEVYVNNADDEDSNYEKRRRENQIYSLKNEIEKLEKRRRSLRNEIVDIQTEINTLRAY